MGDAVLSARALADKGGDGGIVFSGRKRRDWSEATLGEFLFAPSKLFSSPRSQISLL